jgi:hypothetical protein
MSENYKADNLYTSVICLDGDQICGMHSTKFEFPWSVVDGLTQYQFNLLNVNETSKLLHCFGSSANKTCNHLFDASLVNRLLDI